MNGTALIAEFRDLSQDVNEPYLWDDTFVLGKLNEAEREAADRARLLFDDSTEAVEDIAVTAGMAKYATSHLILDIERAFLVVDGESSPLHLYDRHELDRLRDDWRTESDTPTGLAWSRTCRMRLRSRCSSTRTCTPWPRKRQRSLSR